MPAPFRGFAAERLTEHAINAKDSAAALREARHLVRARPMPAEHMRLLSQAAALAGSSELALAAMEAATSRGWRDSVAQLAALLAQPEGRAAFARQLVSESRWGGNSVTSAAQVVPPDRLAPTLAQAQAEGAALPCDRLAVVAASYTASGNGASGIVLAGDLPAAVSAAQF